MGLQIARIASVRARGGWRCDGRLEWFPPSASGGVAVRRGGGVHYCDSGAVGSTTVRYDGNARVQRGYGAERMPKEMTKLAERINLHGVVRYPTSHINSAT